MKIVISGVETNNKGAELMLYAMLKEIEHRFPDAIVYVPWGCDIATVKTKLCLKYSGNYYLSKFAMKFKLVGLMKKLHMSTFYFSYLYPVNSADYFLDANGFFFSDQWNIPTDILEGWSKQLSSYKRQKTKIVFLPQAFGPVNLENTRQIIRLIDKYADLIFTREIISDKYVRSLSLNQNKIQICTDFTATVEKEINPLYEKLKGAVCIIPNSRMLDKGSMTKEAYVDLLRRIVKMSKMHGKKSFFLNHEGKNDESLAIYCAKEIGEDTCVVSGLNALEVKGVISNSYLCISSRFHGVASALNSEVPCLATSWSHKYKELFKDYSQDECVLDIENIDLTLSKIESFLDPSKNAEVRTHLHEVKPYIIQQVQTMWNKVWKI